MKSSIRGASSEGGRLDRKLRMALRDDPTAPRFPRRPPRRRILGHRSLIRTAVRPVQARGLTHAADT